MVDTDDIPTALTIVSQWVCWRTEDRDGKATKVPVDPTTGGYASVSAPETWSDYDTAVAYYRDTAGVEGIGFVFTAVDPYTGVDLDDCRDPETGDVDDWAVDVLRQLDSYTERSPSGTGFHVIVEGDVPDCGNRAGQLEMYDRDRYFTVTGDRVPGAPRSVEQRSEELVAVHEEYIMVGTQDAASDTLEKSPDIDLANEELLEKARNAANGDKFERLYDRGDTAGYESHSEADMALCTMLAFWTGGDAQRMERLFSRSGLVRDKWRDRPDYRKRTIRTAIKHCPAFYDPDVE